MNTRRNLSLLGAAAGGAVAMFLLDPVTGKRRMSLIRDQIVSVGTQTGRMIRGRSEDLKNRAYGLYCKTKSLFGSRCASDRGLRESGTSAERRVS